jgi:hypothetical protein
MVQDARGGVVSDAGQLAVGDDLRITFANGWAQTEVKKLGGVLLSDETDDGEL